MKFRVTGRPVRGVAVSALALALLSWTAVAESPAGSILATTEGTSHKLQVSDPVLAAKIANSGGKLIADYGGYQIYETTRIPAEIAADAQLEVRDQYNFITLNAKQLDTRAPEVKALRKSVGDFTGKQLHLVHFAGPAQQQWRDELLAAGVQIVTYVPYNAYLVYGDAKSIARVQSLAASSPHIQWEAPYAAEYKVHPRARPLDEKGNPRVIATKYFAVQMVSDPAENTGTLALLNTLKKEPFKRHETVAQYVNVVANLNPFALNLIAAQPDVVSIQPYVVPQEFCERQDQIIAGNLSNGIPTGPGYLKWLETNGFTQAQFTASAFTVDISDSGIDEGTTTPSHFGLHVGGVYTAASRVTYSRLEGSTSTNFYTLAGCDGHGTVNAHIVSGYDDYTASPFIDNVGYHFGLGVCPFVTVGASVIFNPFGSSEGDVFTSPNYTTLQSQAYHNGARISNNSWGASGEAAGLYTFESQTYDMLVRDAQPTNVGNQEMVIVFAAGNSGVTNSVYGDIGAPGTAKNVITVGAADNVQAFGGADSSGVGDDQASNANEIADFSSRGPCVDGRIKPDLVAPGTHVSGGVAQWARAPVSTLLPASGTGTADPCFDGSGVSGGVGSIFFPESGQQFYTACSGTSQAAPCVSGGCALLRQYFINNNLAAPSPAMTKAYLMNSARYLTGTNANDNLWSTNQGMGEMNLGTAFDKVPRIMVDETPTNIFNSAGGSYTYYGTIATTNAFRVTLAWTDPAGNTTGAALVNDLDLTVTIGGVKYKGNVFKGQYSVTGGAADTVDNVENVVLPPGVSGNFVVTVNAANIQSPQDFALVIYNGTAAPGVSIPTVPATGAYTVTANSCTPANGAVNPDEIVTVNFVIANTGSASTTNLTAVLLGTGGVTASSGAPVSYGAIPAGGSAGGSFTFTANGTCGATITPTLQLFDGARNLGTLTYSVPLGAFISRAIYTNSFDTATPPALPVGWTTSGTNALTGVQTNWQTTLASWDTPPLSAFIPDVASAGVSELISPAIPIVTASAQLTFRQKFSLENSPSTPSVAHDGGVLLIQIGNSAFTNILDAGGSFVGSGGYNSTITGQYGNPLAGQPAWSGNSAGWITTTINLPAAAAGENIKLMWVLGTDTNNTYSVTGWYVDTIAVLDGIYSCCGSSDLAVSILSAPANAAVGEQLQYVITVTNAGPSDASSVTIFDTLPANVTFVSGSTGCINVGANVYCVLNSLAAGSSTSINFLVMPTVSGSITNTVSVSSSNPDPNSANNSATNVTSVVPDTPVTFILQPVAQTVGVGGTATFEAAATGEPVPVLQWYYNLTNIIVGATNSSLTLSNLQLSAAGFYSVVASNYAGTVSSDAALLTVLAPPAIITQPASQTVDAGSTANFQVTVAGTPPLVYQWYYNGAAIPGASAATLSLPGVQFSQAGSYSVIVTNSQGSVISSVATLTVVLAPGADLAVGQSPSLSPAILGINFAYTIGVTNFGPAAAVNVIVTDFLPPSLTLVSAPGFTQTGNTLSGNFGTLPVGGTTNLTITVTPESVGLVTNAVTVASSTPDGYPATSISTNVLSITLAAPPVITVQPANQTVVPGQVTFLTPTNTVLSESTNVSFQVVATGVPAPTYQWIYNLTNIIVGATNSTLLLTNVQLNEVGSYEVVASNISGSVTSAIANLTVVLPIDVLTPPANQTVNQGDPLVSFSIQLGGAGNPLLQWYFDGTPLVNNNHYAGVDTATLYITNITTLDAGTYMVTVSSQVQNAGSGSAVASLTVIPTTLLADVSVTQSNNATAGSLGLGQSLTYTINVANHGPQTAAGVVLVDTLPANTTLGSVTAGYQVTTNGNLVFDIGQLAIGASSNVTFTVTPSVIGPITNVANVTTTDSDPDFSNNSSTNITTVAFLQPVILTQPVNQIVTAIQTITVTGTNQVITPTTNVVFQVTDSSTPPATYQWYFNVTNAVTNVVSTNGSLVFTNVTLAMVGDYSVVVSNPAGSVTSAVATLSVILPLTIESGPTNETIVDGTSSTTFSIVVGGATGATYQWFFDGVQLLTSGNKYWLVPVLPPGGVAVSTVTNSTLQINAVTFQDAGTYMVQVNSVIPGAGSATAVASLTVLPQANFRGPRTFAVNLKSVNGVHYTLQYNTVATGGTWVTLPASALVGNGGIITLQDTDAGAASRFYRIITN